MKIPSYEVEMKVNSMNYKFAEDFGTLQSLKMKGMWVNRWIVCLLKGGTKLKGVNFRIS